MSRFTFSPTHLLILSGIITYLSATYTEFNSELALNQHKVANIVAST